MNAKLIKLLVCEKEFTNTETEIICGFDYNNMSNEELEKSVFNSLYEYEDSFLPTIYDENELMSFAEDIVKGGDFYDGDETFKLIETTLYY